MSMAALTPQVRTFLFCDEAVLSDIEDAVFNLEGVRQLILVDSFPHWHSLNLFLALVYPPGGTFSGVIRLVENETEDVIHQTAFDVAFDAGDDALFLPIEVGPCIFTEPGK